MTLVSFIDLTFILNDIVQQILLQDIKIQGLHSNIIEAPIVFYYQKFDSLLFMNQVRVEMSKFCREDELSGK